jgi:riboflavin biosynthesis pyrimidine reductase
MGGVTHAGRGRPERDAHRGGHRGGRRLKAELSGEIAVAGPNLAQSLAGLVDEYRLYLHPVVLGSGTPFFAGSRPPLRLAASDLIVEGVLKLTYVPA